MVILNSPRNTPSTASIGSVHFGPSYEIHVSIHWQLLATPPTLFLMVLKTIWNHHLHTVFLAEKKTWDFGIIDISWKNVESNNNNNNNNNTFEMLEVPHLLMEKITVIYQCNVVMGQATVAPGWYPQIFFTSWFARVDSLDVYLSPSYIIAVHW